MSYFDDASLVMIPSGYKDQKVYSVKPIDGSGDLTFSRASNATRINSSGLVEKVRTNLALYSEQFDNATWQKTSSGTGVVPVVTANTTTAPDGTTTADTIVFNSGAGTTSSDYSTIYQLFSVSSATYTFSFYGKVASGTADIMLRLDSSQGYITKTLTTTWQRFDIKFTGASGFVEIGIRRGINEPIASSATVQLWGAMMEVSDFGPTQYIPTTSAAVSVGPVSGLPRLDYSGGASCPSLLLEPQRTNKITYSENQGPTGTNWYPSTTWTVTTNTVTSPDGYTNADTLTETATTGFHSSYFNSTIDNSYTGTYTISAFAKYNGRFFVLSPKGSAERTYFNLQTGTVAQAGTGVTASIVDYGNGWYRCICTATFASENVNFEHLLASAVGTLQYTGDGTSGVHIWGCMAEAGAYATSYIPTLSTAVTRVNDAASKTGISSLIGQTAGTFFAEYTADSFASGARIVTLSDGTLNTRITLFCDSNEKIHIYAATLAGGQQIDQATTIDFTGNHKVAFAYANNDLAVYVDGTQAITSSGFSVPACSNMYLGSVNIAGIPLSGGIKQSLLFTSRLTNADLATLTA